MHVLLYFLSLLDVRVSAFGLGLYLDFHLCIILG